MTLSLTAAELGFHIQRIDTDGATVRFTFKPHSHLFTPSLLEVEAVITALLLDSHRVDELEAELRWALDWIADGLATPPHDCGFLGDTGHCTFHERFFEVCQMLDYFPNQELAANEQVQVEEEP